MTLFPKDADNVIKFVRELRRTISSGNKQVLNFSKTTRISTLGAVYLYSEIDRTISTGSSVRIKSLGTSNRQIRTTLKSTGILQLCGHQIAPKNEAGLTIIKG